jgi:hypothetical protein
VEEGETRTVNVVPEPDSLVHVGSTIDTRKDDLGLRGGHDTGRLHESVSSEKDGVEHRLVKEEVSHPLHRIDPDQP